MPAPRPTTLVCPACLGAYAERLPGGDVRLRFRGRDDQWRTFTLRAGGVVEWPCQYWIGDHRARRRCGHVNTVTAHAIAPLTGSECARDTVANGAA